MSLNRLSCSIALVVVIALLAGGTGCNEDNELFEGVATFVPSNPNPTLPDSITLSGATIDASTVRVDVVIIGPTTSSDLYSFVFDIVLADGTVAQYVPGSATFGDALQLGAGQGQSILVAQQGNRVIVGVSKTSGGAGNGVPSGTRTIASLKFQIPTAGAVNLDLEGSPANPLNPSDQPAALDSAGNVVGSIVFDTNPAAISR